MESNDESETEVTYFTNRSENAQELKADLEHCGFRVREVLTASAEPSVRYGGVLLFGYVTIYDSFIAHR